MSHEGEKKKKKKSIVSHPPSVIVRVAGYPELSFAHAMVSDHNFIKDKLAKVIHSS